MSSSPSVPILRNTYVISPVKYRLNGWVLFCCKKSKLFSYNNPKFLVNPVQIEENFLFALKIFNWY
jgi:hypothetical protein